MIYLSAVWLLHGWYNAKVLSPRLRSVYTIQPCTGIVSLYLKPHTLGACVFSCNLPPELWAKWPGVFFVLQQQHKRGQGVTSLTNMKQNDSGAGLNVGLYQSISRR